MIELHYNYSDKDIYAMINNFMNNKEILKELGSRIKDTRIGLNYTQSELAHRANISLSTVTRAEKGDNITLEQLIIILRELHLLNNLELLIPQTELTPLELFEKKTKRQRVKKKHIINEWKWGDE